MGVGKFFSDSKILKGRQSLQNRLESLTEIVELWLDQEMNDDEIRILMQKSIFNHLKI